MKNIATRLRRLANHAHVVTPEKVLFRVVWTDGQTGERTPGAVYELVDARFVLREDNGQQEGILLSS